MMTRLLSTDKGPVTIRAAVAADAAALRELRLEALGRSPVMFSADFDATAAQSVEFWAERLVQDEQIAQGITCIAVAGNQLIGLCGLHRGGTPKTRHSGTIWGVYVREEWRGLRVAEALINECTAWGGIHGVVIAKLGVISTNAAAIRCYIRCGFTVYGIEPQAICFNDVHYDEILMSKSLRS